MLFFFFLIILFVSPSFLYGEMDVFDPSPLMNLNLLRSHVRQFSTSSFQGRKLRISRTDTNPGWFNEKIYKEDHCDGKTTSHVGYKTNTCIPLSNSTSVIVLCWSKLYCLLLLILFIFISLFAFRFRFSFFSDCKS
jgi:hypothetical protein